MLPKVSLADLRAEELAEEMARRIPAHTPEWRNARPGDPGRTLIDLFAWLGETLLYRANLTPRRMRLEFLNLLNLKQRPAQPATGLLQFGHKAPAAAKPVFVAPGTRATAPVPFEVLTPATVQPVEGQVFVKRRLGEAERAELAEVLASLGDVYGVEDMEPYATERLFGPGDMAKPEGVDPFADSIDATLWVGLFALDETAAAREAVRAALDAQPCVLNVGVIPRMVLPEEEEPSTPGGLSWTVSSPGAEAGEVAYLDLPVEDDRTAGLTAEGTLRLVLPRAAMVWAPSNDIVDEIDAGVGDRPPRLDDATLAGRLVGWLRLVSDDPAGRLPLSWIGVNAVAVDQRETYANVLLGTATGQAGQRFRLPVRDIDPATLSVAVAQPGAAFEAWDQVTDLGGAGRDAQAYELDAEAGEILFGDDLTGRALRPGARVRLDYGRGGGGTAGNLAAGTVAKVQLPGLVAFQPAAFHGGVEAETLEAAEKRVGAMLHHRNRCVTEDDYRAIGAELGLARIEVLPGFRPYQQRYGSAGVVAVMAFPAQAVRRPANPRADRRLIEQVRAHLDPRRPLGTELYVISPDYVAMGATAAIGLAEGYAREEVVRAVKERLYALLWPLAPGGAEGTGWALGRAVRNLELEVEIARIPGVRTTQGVNLFTVGETGFKPVAVQSATGQQVLTVEEWQLPELLAVEIAVGAAAPPSTLALPGTGGTGGKAVGVPVVPEVC